MSIEQIEEPQVQSLVFGDVSDLLFSLKKSFSQKTNNKLKERVWEKSNDPEAVLIRNLQNLYNCHKIIHLDSDYETDEEEFFNEHQICDEWLKKPLKHLLLSQDNASPIIVEFLDKFFDKEKITALRKVYQSKKDIITFDDMNGLLKKLKKEFSQNTNTEIKQKLWESSDEPSAIAIRKIERILRWNKKKYKKNLELDFHTEEDDLLFNSLSCDRNSAHVFATTVFENSKHSEALQQFLNEHYSVSTIETLQQDDDIPKITYGDIYQLLKILKNDFKDKINKEYWMQSTNPTAVLLRNLRIVYHDNKDAYLTPDEIELDVDDEENRIVDVFHQKSSVAASKKILRSVFKWGNKTPQIMQYLKERYSESAIENYRKAFEDSQQKKSQWFRENTICIDEGLSQNYADYPEFIKFVGRAKNVYIFDVEKSEQHKRKMELFLKVIQEPDFFKHKIFKDPLILSIALAAVARREITPEQYATLSPWIELRKVYGKEKIKVYSFFYKKGKFTLEAKKHIREHLLNLKEGIFDKPHFTKETLKVFRSYLEKLPPSSRVFVVLNVGKNGYNRGLRYAYNSFRHLVLFGKEYTSGFFFPFSPYQCFMNTLFPSRAILEPRLGEVTEEDIEIAHRVDEHPVNVYFTRPADKHTPSSSRYVHKRACKTTAEGALHDHSHGLVLAGINKKGFHATHYAMDVIRDQIFLQDKKAKSKGLWRLSDINSYSEGTSEIAQAADVFYFLMDFAYPKEEFLPEAAAVYLDIYFYPEKWKWYFNSAELFITNNKHWAALDKYDEYFYSDDDVKFNTFKLMVIEILNNSQHSSSDIKTVLSECNLAWEENKNFFLDNITFKKHKKEFLNKTKKIKEEMVFAYVCWGENIVDADNIIPILEKITDIAYPKNNSSQTSFQQQKAIAFFKPEKTREVSNENTSVIQDKAKNSSMTNVEPG